MQSIGHLLANVPKQHYSHDGGCGRIEAKWSDLSMSFAEAVT